jgi:hypothetical protein
MLGCIEDLDADDAALDVEVQDHAWAQLLALERVALVEEQQPELS